MKRFTLVLSLLTLLLTACGEKQPAIESETTSTGDSLEESADASAEPTAAPTPEATTEPEPEDTTITCLDATEFVTPDYAFSEDSLYTEYVSFKPEYYAEHQMSDGGSIRGYYTEEAYNFYTSMRKQVGPDVRLYVECQHRSEVSDTVWGGFFYAEYDDVDYVYYVWDDSAERYYIVRNGEFQEVPTTFTGEPTSARRQELPNNTQEETIEPEAPMIPGLPYDKYAIRTLIDTASPVTLECSEEEFEKAYTACGVSTREEMFDIIRSTINEKCDFPTHFPTIVEHAYDGVDHLGINAVFYFKGTSAHLVRLIETNTWEFWNQDEDPNSPMILYADNSATVNESLLNDMLCHTEANAGRWLLVHNFNDGEDIQVDYLGDGFIMQSNEDFDVTFNRYDLGVELDKYGTYINEQKPGMYAALAEAGKWGKVLVFDYMAYNHQNLLCLRFQRDHDFLIYDNANNRWVYVKE